jgi:hypothetical protein
MKISNLLVKFLVVLGCMTFVLTSADFAQTSKKKKRSTRKPTVTKTVNQTNGAAAVVSLADQYEDSTKQIIEPTRSLADTQPALSDETTKKLKELQSRIKKLETVQPAEKKSTYEEKQKLLLTNLDILTKAEQRSESIRKQRFELVEKENTMRSRIDQIDLELRPESIDRNVALIGSLRPEELREARRKSLESEKRNLQNLINEIATTRARLDNDLLRSDALVEKLRQKLEQDIEAALADDPDQ